MANTFFIKQNDTAPNIEATLKDGNDVVVDLTGATVRFHMKDSAGTVKVDGSAGITAPATGGVVTYGWAAADTDTVGSFKGEFEVTYAGGEIETFPNYGYIPIKISDDIT